MKTSWVLGVALGLSVLVACPVFADILVLNNGQVYIGQVSTSPSGRYKMTSEYGDQFFPKEQVANFWVTTKGLEAESFYQAGLLVLGKGNQETARQLFEKCVAFDASYRDKCNAAVTARPATTPTAAQPGLPITTITTPAPQAQPYRVQCAECSGTGTIMQGSSLREQGGGERPRPCPICGARGFKDLQVPPGYDICADCSGFGATLGDTGGSEKQQSFTIKKNMCPRCAGRGLVKAAFKPTEGTPGTQGSIMGVSPGGSSPAPGSAPTGVYNIVRDRAKDVASGRPPDRPIGPSGIRPVSPTLIEQPTSAGGASAAPAPSGQTEEVVEESPSGSSGSSSEKKSEESKSSDESGSSSDYDQPGFIGKVNKHKWFIVIGGLGLLVFAAVMNKMKAKKVRR